MIGNKLKLLRNKFNKSQIEISKELNISPQAYSNYENDKRTPDLEIISKIADYFNVTVDFLMGRTDKLDDLEIIRVDKKRKVPLLGTVQAGEPVFAEENILDEFDIPDLDLPKGDIFFLRVSGDSMNRKHIIDGSLILVEHTNVVSPGEVAVIIINNDEATVKEFHKSSNIITLMPDSTSDSFTPIVVNTNKVPVLVVGKVLKVVIDVK